jgi:hypothetical protein
MRFLGPHGSTAALETTLTLATVSNCIGLGFQHGSRSHARNLVCFGAESDPTIGIQR